MGYDLGVDLGGTAVAAASRTGSSAAMVPLGDGSTAAPAVVYRDDDGTLLAGDAAASRAIEHPDRAGRDLRRRLGSPTPVRLGGQPYPPAVLLGTLLQDVVARVAERLGSKPERVILTHPAHWSPTRRAALTDAIRGVGLPEVRTVTEPEAVAAHYAATGRLPEGDTVAVYDLGGSGFDATVLRRTGQGVELLGLPEGIERLGGGAFDEAILSHVNQVTDAPLAGLDRRDPEHTAAVGRLRQACVRAKHALSGEQDVRIPVRLPNRQTEVTLTRSEFEQMIRSSIETTIGSLLKALQAAQVEPGELAAVVLVGGSSRIPLVTKMIKDALARPIVLDEHPKHPVALGAAVLAGTGAGSTPVSAPTPAPTRVPVPRDMSDWSRTDFGVPTGHRAAAAATVSLFEPVTPVSAVGPAVDTGAAARTATITDTRPAADPPTEALRATTIATAEPDTAARPTDSPTTDSPAPVGPAPDNPAPDNQGRDNQATDNCGSNGSATDTTTTPRDREAGSGTATNGRTEPSTRSRLASDRPVPGFLVPDHPLDPTPVIEPTTPVRFGRPPHFDPAPGIVITPASPRPDGAGRRGRRVLIGLVVAALVAMLAGAGYLVWNRLPGSPGAPPAAQPAAPGQQPAAPAASVHEPRVTATVPVGETPGFVVISPDGRRAMIANQAAGMITVLDTATNEVIATIPVPAGPPQYLSFSPNGERVYVSIWDQARTVAAVGVLDTTTNAIVATIPVRTRPYLSAVTPDGQRLYVPNHDSGTISVIDTVTNAVTTEIKVAPNPHWVEMSSDGTRAYVANHESNLVSVVDTNDNSILAEVPVQTSPHSLAVHPTRPLVANVNYDAASVTAIDTGTDRVVATIPVGKNPQDITWAPDGRHAYVVNTSDNTVSVIDPETATVTATVPTGSSPTSVAVLPDGSAAYVSNLGDGTLSVLSIAD